MNPTGSIPSKQTLTRALTSTRKGVLVTFLLALSLQFGWSQPLELEGSTRAVHDPVIMQQGDRYYLFSTGPGITIRCSDDLLTWELCSAAFFGLPRWIKEHVPAVTDLWAPDIAFHDGRYLLYYSASSFGQNRSAIGLATNTTLDVDSDDYVWEDQGLVIESFPGDNWNAIDPNFVLDREGQPWLAFGSFWSGIKLRRLDPATGKPSDEDPTLYSLARRSPPGAVEAPFIVNRNGHYYLFVSFDQCCRGVDSSYNIRVGRASEITGPYLDRDGVPLLEGGGTLLLAFTERWRGPGHNAILEGEAGDFLVYHAYDAENFGQFFLRIEPLVWGEDGWPTLTRDPSDE